METVSTSANSTQTLTGCVKWFNNGLNYGFITVLSEGEYRNTDVFVHQSNIQTARDCFRMLYTGECVQFELAKSDNEKHPFHAIKVRGFNNVQLRCETPRGTGFGRGRGRNGGRMGGRRNPHRNAGDSYQQSSDSVVETQENSSASDMANTTTDSVVSTTTKNASASVAKGRGQGRGRKVSV
jgi:cold shock CspA family protein